MPAARFGKVMMVVVQVQGSEDEELSVELRFKQRQRTCLPAVTDAGFTLQADRCHLHCFCFFLFFSFWLHLPKTVSYS